MEKILSGIVAVCLFLSVFSNNFIFTVSTSSLNFYLCLFSNYLVKQPSTILRADIDLKFDEYIVKNSRG